MKRNVFIDWKCFYWQVLENDSGFNNNYYKNILTTHYYTSAVKAAGFSSMEILIDVKVEF